MQQQIYHTNLGYCYIRAPFNGTVSRSLYDVGKIGRAHV